MFRTRFSKTQQRHGQAAVEFTLAIPILLLVMTGALSFGLALHNFLLLTNSVNIGAQYLAVSRGQTTDPCATAYSSISTAAPSLAANITLSFVIDGVSYPSTNTCSAGAANMVQGASAQITASYPCSLAIVDMAHTCNLKTQVTEYIQ
jgi:Flp pilus assembly protein TadG